MLMIKRVLFFHEEFPCGGAERVTLDIGEHISAHGYEVYVLAHRVKRLDYDHLTVIQIPEKCEVRSLTNANYIVEVINTLSIDVFVLPVWPLYDELEYIKGNTSCKLAFALHSAPLWEVICGLNDKKNRSKNSLPRLLLWYLLVYPKTKWIKTYDASIINVHKKIYSVVDRYIVLCEGYRSFLVRKMKLYLTDSKMCVIHNSQAVPLSVNLDKKKQILFVGRMNYVDKRIDRLIDIWGMIYRNVPEWELILVGDGSERETLELKVQRMKLERVRFVGRSDKVSDYYQDASILCLTSTFEGWPLCLTEAQSYGVVPIAFDCTAGVHEILSPSGVNGSLITPFKKKKYARALLELINNPKQLQKMRLNVIRKSKEYSSEVARNKWLELFNSLCR